MCGCDVDQTAVTADQQFSMAPRARVYAINAETGELVLVADQAMENADVLMDPSDVDLVIQIAGATGTVTIEGKTATWYYRAAADPDPPALTDALARMAQELIAVAKATGDVTDVIEHAEIDTDTGYIQAYSCSYCVDATWAAVSFELGVFVVSDTQVSCEFPCIYIRLDGMVTEADLRLTIESLDWVQVY